MSQPSIYTGQQLSNRTIRLLFLQPSSDSQQPARCFCRCYEIEAAPPYEALSYVWGAIHPTTEVRIICNDEVVLIGANLASALYRLRLPGVERILWADALCIDQNNNDEKSHQVPLMGSIYSHASRVVVWLGYEDPDLIKETTRCLNIIANACQERGKGSDVRFPYKDVDLPPFTIAATGFRGLKLLYRQPYFSRVWCIQETRLAQNIIVIWGEQEIPWSHVGLTAEWFWDHTVADRSLGEIPCRNALMMYTPARRMRLLDTLNWYRSWHATDRRDKVYGLLGIVAPKSEADAVNVDYGKGSNEVYTDVVLSAIRLYSTLTPLTFVIQDRIYHVYRWLKSWVPDWDLEVRTVSPMFEHLFKPSMSACKGRLVTNIDEDHVSAEHLRLTGIPYSSVAAVHTIMTQESLEDLGSLRDLGAFLLPPAEDPQEYALANDKDILNGWRTVARTLTAGWLNDEGEFLDETFCTAIESVVQDILENKYNEYATKSPAQTEYLIRARLFCHYRCIFRLQNGTFGLGPQCINPGDVVAVLYGGFWPAVLRPSDDQYLFMGTAYVDEMMHGKLVEEVEAGERQEQEFCLV